MRRPWWLVVVLGGLIAAGPAGPSDEDREYNKKLLSKWDEDPAHSARLRADLDAFHKLKSQRQDQIRKLDQELHALGPAEKERLWAVLKRYRAWVDRLPEEKRKEILDTAPRDRIEMIREIRQDQWIARLPRKLQDELKLLDPKEKAKRVTTLREEEREQKRLWLRSVSRTGAAGKPTKLAEFPPEVQAFVREKLMPRMTKDERKGFEHAEKVKWPELRDKIKILAKRYQVLPPLQKGPIAKWEDLPKSVQMLAAGENRPGLPSNVAMQDGKWPDYALAVVAHIKRERGPNEVLPPLGASKLDEFPREIRAFVAAQLLPKLTEDKRVILRSLEGRWPDYPERLLDLARRSRLVIPGMSLPGPSDLWDDKVHPRG